MESSADKTAVGSVAPSGTNRVCRRAIAEASNSRGFCTKKSTLKPIRVLMMLNEERRRLASTIAGKLT
jgi:hypothetical protein